jgi:phytoene dehydrogenase-like protein
MKTSVREWADSELHQEPVRELILATLRLATYTNAPDLMSAGAALSQLEKALARGVLYLDRGWQTLVEGLAGAARAAGVSIETGIKTELIERDAAGCVAGVRLADGRLIRCSNVVIASPPLVAANLVDRGDETSLAKWAAESTPVKAACLDVALRRLPVPKATFALGIDSPLYLSVHSAAAKLAPEGSALIQTAKYLPLDHAGRAEDDELELENLLDLVQPGWRSEIVYRRFLPEMVVMNAMASTQTSGTINRPGPRVEEVPGLFVAGDWVGPEGLLVDASLASAKLAAELMTSEHRVAATAAF